MRSMRSISNPITGFFGWWIGALHDCVPASAKRMLASIFLDQSSDTVVVLENGQAVVFAASELALREFGTAASSDKPTVQALVRKTPGKGRDIILALPPHRVMQRTLTFPAKAEGDLKSALVFSVEQVTPLKSKEAQWDWRIGHRDAISKTFNVDLFVAPARVVEEHLAAAHALGLSPIRVDVLNETRSALMNVGLARSALSFKLPRVSVAFVASAAIACLCILMLSSIFLKQRDAAAITDAKLEQLKSQATPVLAERTRLQSAEVRLKLLSEVQSSTASTSVLLNNLAQILPDNTWLFEVELHGLEVNISGESEDAAGLLAAIDGSPDFANARFTSALTRGTHDNSERFVLSFDIDEAVAP